MNKQNANSNNNFEDLREHYTFDYNKAKPNRFAERLSKEMLVVILDPDVAAAFPTQEAVNDALRLVMQLSKIPKAKVPRVRKRKAA